MSYRVADILQAIKKVGSLPGAEPYHGELKFLVELLAKSAISSSHIKKALDTRVDQQEGPDDTGYQAVLRPIEIISASNP